MSLGQNLINEFKRKVCKRRVKTIKDFEKELRTKIRDEFETKPILILQEFYLLVSFNCGKISEMGDIVGLK